MVEKNLTTAVTYYQEMGKKNLALLEKYIDPDIRFIGPMASMTGKEAYLNSVKQFMTLFDTLTIRASFASKDQAMLAYDVHCPAPIGIIRGAALLTFKNGLITSAELFYDTQFVANKKNEIFTKS